MEGNAGIYCITNKINNKKYIGQSTDLEERKRGHKYSIRSSSPKYYLQRALSKYGIENFTFEVIETCEEKYLDEREVYWIKQYGTYGGGYNLTLGGTKGNMKIDEDTYLKIVNDLKTIDKSQDDIGKKYGISGKTVSYINSGYRYKRKGFEYPIRKYYGDKEENCCVGCNIKIDKSGKRCMDCYQEYNKRNIPEKEFLIKNIAEKGFEGVGREKGVTGNAVKRWCEVRGLPRKIKEIEYLYEKGELPKEKEEVKGSGYHWKDIEVTTPEGNIKTFENITEFIEYIGISKEKEIKRWRKSISRVLKGNNKTYKGYKFKGSK